jgi:hypothetical protein
MPDWLHAWFSKRRPASPLARRLATYASYDAPHVGQGRQLSEAQARANLAYFEQALPHRLHGVALLLREQAGIEVDAALAAPAAQGPALADALHHWAAEHWPALHGSSTFSAPAWRHSRREGEGIVFAMLLDVAILLGELVRRGNPQWRWALDLDPDNLADGMPSARRVVLLAEPLGRMPCPFVLDVEDIVVQRFLHVGKPGHGWINPFRRLVEEGLRGDAMAFWKQQASARA